MLAGGRLVLTNSAGQIVSASVDSGKVGTVIENKAPFTLPPVVANNTLYVLDQKGRVWLKVPPGSQFDGGSLTPLLIDARED